METTPEDKKMADRKAYMKKYYAENIKSFKEKGKKYYDENVEAIKLKKKRYYSENSENVLAKNKKYREENSQYVKNREKKRRKLNAENIRILKKKYYAENSERLREEKRKYRKENPEKIRTTNNKYIKNKFKTDPIFKIKANIRNRLRMYFKSANIKKTNKTFYMVGCTPEFLMDHLEMLFKEGMTRENYGSKGWVIDHIIPLASAGSDIEKTEKLCHYTNLQPLWWYDNLSKGSRI